MYNIASLYPISDESYFDLDYYLEQHMPMSIDILSTAKGFRGVSVEQGQGLESAGIGSSYHAMCHYYFDTLEDFLTAFQPHAQQLQDDISNYTNVTPVIQINKVLITQTADTE